MSIPGELQGRLFGGRYRTTRRIKEGQGVETFMGEDLRTGLFVVIKTAGAAVVSKGEEWRLEHEAQVLREVLTESRSAEAGDHSAIPVLLAVGREEGWFYLVMPYVPGVTLEERLSRGPLPLRETLTVGTDLLRALRDVHRHCIHHRDVKPSNVIVDDGPVVRNATLIDFGLSRSDRLDPTLRDLPVGTVRYMAPEQAGLIDYPVDGRADLYALGIVLYECLSGTPPFEADELGLLLRQHLSVSPPPLRGKGVPDAIDEIIHRLLRKDPRDRYQTAEGVLSDLEQITEHLDRDGTVPEMVIGLRDHRTRLTEPGFIGREAEMASLDEQLQRARSGEGGLVLLEGLSGGGKSRLLAEWAERIKGNRLWILRGYGEDQVAQRPFQLLDGVIADLRMSAAREPGLLPWLQDRLGELQQPVGRALPALGELLGMAVDVRLGPEAYGEMRSQQALVSLLDVIGSPERPAVVLLDDGQWGDESTLRLLERWSHPRHPRYVLIVVAYRTDEVAEGHLLRKASAQSRIGLPPFGREELVRLVESMAGRLPDPAVELIVRLSEGSPFMATALLQGMVECGALVEEMEPAGGRSWRVEHRAMDEVQSSRRAAVFLTRRLERLPRQVLQFLSGGAILGKEFGFDLAVSLSGQMESEAFHCLEEARRRQIIWVDPHRRCVFVHDKLREALLARLSEAERRRLHRLAAVCIEAVDHERVFDLAYHFDAAGESKRSLPYALAAAERARSQYALAIATVHYAIAERGARGRDEATRLRVAEGLGDVLMLRGEYPEAGERLEQARALALDRTVQARILTKIGELAFKCGDMKAAGEALEEGLRLLGRPVPRNILIHGICFLWEVWVQLLHTAFPARFVGRGARKRSKQDLLAVRLYSRLAYAYWFSKSVIRVMWAHLCELNLAEREASPPELAQAYSNHSVAMTVLPRFSRAKSYAEKGIALRREMKDPWGLGQSYHFYGLVLYCASEYEQALAKSREAYRLLDQTGDRWEANNAAYHVALCLYRMGHLEQARQQSQWVQETAVRMGDIQAGAISLETWAKASDGKVPVDLIEEAVEPFSEDIQRVESALQAKGLFLIGQGRYTEAAEVFDRSYHAVRRAGFRNEYIAPILPWMATALRLAAESLPPYEWERRHGIVCRARRAARKGLRQARSFRNNLPHALRECGLLEALLGRKKRARRLIEESLAVADAQGARFEHAQSLLAYGRVGLSDGWPKADESLAAGQKALRHLGGDWVLRWGYSSVAEDLPSPGPEGQPTATLSLADRFGTVLEEGRKIASALDQQTVYAAVRDAALTLLRGDDCLIFVRNTSSEAASGLSGPSGSHASRGPIPPPFPSPQGEGYEEDASRELPPSPQEEGSQVETSPLKGNEGCKEEAPPASRTKGFEEKMFPSNGREDMRESASFPSAPNGIEEDGSSPNCTQGCHEEVSGFSGPEEVRASRLTPHALRELDASRLTPNASREVHASRPVDMTPEEIEAVCGDPTSGYSWTVVRKVFLEGRPAIVTEGGSDDMTESMILSDVRSILCAPIRVRGETVACFYVTHHQIGDLFGPEEERLAAFIASLAGAALENAEGFARVQGLTQTLEERVDERTEELIQANEELVASLHRLSETQEQLRHSDKMAAVGTLVAGLSHELNNPLTSVIGFAELLLSDNLPASSRAYAERIFEQGQRGAEIIRTLLGFSRKLPPSQEAVNLNGLILSTLDLKRYHLNADNITLALELDMELPPTEADGDQIQQVFLNLLNNAHQAVLKRQEDRRIVLRSERRANRLRVSVQDNGPGIPHDVHARIFEPFFTTKPPGEGTGLGLSTSYSIMESHGGQIGFSSEEGRGTTFWFELIALSAKNE